jgi:hypothetical protein
VALPPPVAYQEEITISGLRESVSFDTYSRLGSLSPPDKKLAGETYPPHPVNVSRKIVTCQASQPWVQDQRFSNSEFQYSPGRQNRLGGPFQNTTNLFSFLNRISFLNPVLPKVVHQVQNPDLCESHLLQGLECGTNVGTIFPGATPAV